MSLDKEHCRKYRLGLYEKAMPASLELKEKLEAAASGGFDYVELSVDESEEKLSRLVSPREWRKDLLGAMSDAGIGLASMCLSGQRKFPMGSADPALRARSMEIIKNAVDLAADLGIRLIQIAGYDVYYEPSTEATRAMFTQNLGAAVEFAASRGVVLAFETMETPFMNTVAKALSFVESIDSPYLQIYPDVGNVTNALEGDAAPARADLEGGKGHIAAAHLKETAPGIFREVPYGRGHVNFDACIAGAANAGARMFVAEFWYAGATDWKAEIVRANSFLRPKLDAYFSAR